MSPESGRAGAEDVARFWSDNPMTYGDVHGDPSYDGNAVELGSREFFERVDSRFLEWNAPLHSGRPFDRIFPFDDFADRPVLEIGCGMGTMSSLWAKAGARVSAVDLNSTAIEQTTKRFQAYGLDGEILQADARELPFEDASFDYVYSWGVLHHSPDLADSLAEMFRVLRPGGGFGLMLYNRRSLLHLYLTAYVEGVLHYERKFLEPVELASRYGDAATEEGNPHTWPVTRGELHDFLSPHSQDASIRLLGTDLDSVLRYMLPGMGDVLPRALRKVLARRFGWSLWASGTRRER